jgi:N6-adenosine-specific RNA methylase IME4
VKSAKQQPAEALTARASFACIVADPPWDFDDGLPGPKRGARKHYRTEGVVRIAELEPYKSLAMAPKDAVLFLWRVSAMQNEALYLANRWGFTVKSEIIWEKTTKRIEHGTVNRLKGLYGKSTDKRDRAALERAINLLSEPRTDHFGMGRIVRGAHETCLVCTRGKLPLQSRSVRSRFRAPVGRHSEKPEAFYALVEQLVPGPYYEFFARASRAGWVCLGDEL